MASTESQIMDIIRDRGGKAHIQEITRETGMSLDYARVICMSLGERDEIDFFKDWCYLRKYQRSGGKVGKKRRRGKKDARAKLSSSLTDELSGYDPEVIAKLVNSGYESLETIAAVPVARFMEATGLELATAAKLINEAREKLSPAKT
mgnify:FL=1